MNKKSKALLSIILIIVQLISLGLLGYSLVLYKGVETFYRIYGIIVLLYLLIFVGYLLLRSIKKKNKIAFVVPLIMCLMISIVQFGGYYYLNKIYKTIDSYSNTKNIASSSLVTYNKKYKSYKDLNKAKIGIITDTSDIEGCVLPNEIIKELKLENNNTIVKYDSTMELLYALKNKEVDAAFFSSNYADMFYSLDGYENIKDETVVLYEKTKKYESKENNNNDTTASLNKPFTMLFIGVDSSKDGVTSGYNADVLLLVTFNPKTLRATLTSVPRDMYLKTACSGNNYRRINTVTWGSSSECAVNTMQKLFDTKIDYYAKINFKGVVQLVDAVGGIDVEVPYSFCEQNSSRQWGDNTITVLKGKQHLNGEQALAMSRNRHKPNDGSGAGKQMGLHCAKYNEGVRNDYTRGKNQMKVILGIVEAGTKLRDPNQAINVLETIKANFQTNIKSKDVLSLYNLGKSIVISDNSNLVNIQRSQLSGYNAWHHVYEPSSKSYPAVTIPYTGSINDIKKEIKNNLSTSNNNLIKKTSFDLNKPYEETLVGQGKYSQAKINTLKSMQGNSVDAIKAYASNNKLKLSFINIDNNQTVNISNWNEYSFHSQKEHKDTIIDQISTLTIYVKKKAVISTPTVKTEDNKPTTTDETIKKPEASE